MRALLLACLVACAGSDEPDVHELGACGSSWGSYATSCERACVEIPANDGSGTDMPCDGVHVGVSSHFCPRTFDFEGQRGCCEATPVEHTHQAWFFECP